MKVEYLSSGAQGSFSYQVADGESLDLLFVAIQGSADAKVSVTLGRASRCTLSGVYVAGEGERINIAVEMLHSAPEAYSRQLFKGVVLDGGRTSFKGLIKVPQDSQKTEAYQENHNLVLGADAVAQTLPQLEIYADDVKCSHGATVGRLDESQLFYLRSRGISLEKAKALQIEAFVADVLSCMPDESEKEQIADKILNKILNR